ncbi:PIR Superfamily Protein, partial [Plasmodium malariae]
MLIMSDEDELGISLPSTLNYNILDKKTSYYSDNICNNLVKDLSDYNNVFEFCEKFRGIIENFNKLSFLGQFPNDTCTVVKFWMYDRLFNLPIRGKKVNYINNIIPKIKTIIKEDDEIQGCDLFDFPYLKEDFDIMKTLYDYATNYGTIKKYIEDSTYICNKNLSNYINTNDELYINEKGKCNRSDKENIGYCKVFKYLKAPYIHENLPRLLCTVKSLETFDPMERHHELHREEGPPEILKQKHSLPFSNIIMAVIFPLLGIFFFLFILCKFTPFKSWLKSHLLKKGIIKFYEGEEYKQEYLNESYHIDGRHI